MVKTDNNQRIGYLDIAKAIGILLMVFEHAETVNDLTYYIAAFHVPIFFFISGFLYKSNDLDFFSFLKKKARSLLLPYFIFGIGHYLFWLYRSPIKTIEPLVAILTGDALNLPIAGSLWFLTALFISEIIYFSLSKLKNNYLRIAMVALIALFGCYSPSILPYTLYYSFSQGCVGVGLMELGSLLHRSRKLFDIIFSKKWYVWLPIIALTLFLIRQNDVVHMFIGYYGIIPLFWINVTLSILIVFKFSIWFENISSNLLLAQYLKDMGKKSIVYLCLNNITINVSRRLIGITGLMQGNIFFNLCLITIILFLLYLESILFTKTKLKILIGQKL